MPARKVEDAIAPYKAQLGKVPDQKIAEDAKVSRSVVVNYRKKLGIPAYEGYKFGVRESESKPTPRPARAVKGGKPESKAPPAKAAKAAPPKAAAPVKISKDLPSAADVADADGKGFRGRKSKLDAYADMLGKVPDSEIARLAGVTQENVRTYRMRRGIVPSKAVTTEAASPPAAPPVKVAAPVKGAEPVARSVETAAVKSEGTAVKGSSVFVVHIETAQGARTYALVANDIGEAAKTAMSRISTRHPKATIKSLQFVAELL